MICFQALFSSRQPFILPKLEAKVLSSSPYRTPSGGPLLLWWEFQLFERKKLLLTHQQISLLSLFTSMKWMNIHSLTLRWPPTNILLQKLMRIQTTVGYGQSTQLLELNPINEPCFLIILFLVTVIWWDPFLLLLSTSLFSSLTLVFSLYFIFPCRLLK